jgi:putative transposon-encoded protein
MNEIMEIKKASETIKGTINATFERLIQTLGDEEATDLPREYVYPLNSDTNIFIGKKPSTVLFGEERIDVKTWREVYGVILKRCNQDEKHHESLLYLRNKVSGKCRVFLSDKPDGMTRPLKIDEGIYGETHYGSATLIHILLNRILVPVGFDCNDIKIIMKARDYT